MSSTQLKYDEGENPEPVELVSPQQTGTLGIHYLKRLWHKTQLQKVGKLDPALNQQEWKLDHTLIDMLGVGLSECLEFLFHEGDEFEAFEQWLRDSNREKFDDARVNNINATLARLVNPAPASPVKRTATFLSAEQLAFWSEQGYLVVEDVLSKAQCQASVELIYEFLNKHPDQPESWYQGHPALQNIMVQLFRHPILDDNRRSEKIRQVFEDLWQTDQLQCSVDRVGFNPPETENYRFQGTRLHWDLNFSQPLEFATQGLIYLADVAQDQGAFCCVPGFHHRLSDWRAELPAGADPNQQDLSELPVHHIAAPAGSLIVWNAFLPHGASPNRAQSPRLVQYINMRA
jgi:ectoine hydroxylase-related dioxygenase (phytanoyl-CoA dioxygenase family)